MYGKTIWKSDKAPGSYNIFNELIKESQAVLLPLLHMYIDFSMSYPVHAGFQKYGLNVLVPLFKKDSVDDTSNYHAQ